MPEFGDRTVLMDAAPGLLHSSAQLDGRLLGDSSADFDLLTEVAHVRVDE